MMDDCTSSSARLSPAAAAIRYARAFAILFLALAVLLGWAILVLAAAQSLGDYLPPLLAFAHEGQKIISESLLFAEENPVTLPALLLVGTALFAGSGLDRML